MQTNRIALWTMALGNFSVAVGSLVIAGILQPMAAELDVSLRDIGVLVTVYALSYALSSPILIGVTGAIGRKRILLAGLSLVIAGNLLAALAPVYEWVFAARILTALGAGLYTPVASGVAAAMSAPAERGRAIAIVFTGFTAAIALGVPLGTYIGLELGWRLTLALVAVLGVVGLISVWIVVPGRLAAAPTSMLAFLGIARRPVVLAILTITVLQMSAQLTVYTYIAPLLQQELGVGTTGISLLLMVFGCASIVGNGAGGYAADRIGPRWVLVLFLGVLALNFALLPLLHGTLVTAVLSMLAWGICGPGFQAPQQTRLLELAPDVQNPILALNASCIYMGQALGSYLGGALAEETGRLTVLGPAAAVLALVAGSGVIMTWRAERSVSQTPVPALG